MYSIRNRKVRNAFLPRQYRPKLRNLVPTWGWVGLVCFIVFVVGCTALVAPSFYERETHTTVVTHKERVCSGDGDSVTCKYLIFTEAGTFELTDAIFGARRFNSSDVYGRIRVDRTYKITSYGWRLPFFSQYPNIDKIEEVKQP